MEMISNRYSQADALTAVMENCEYGGTYDRPWLSSNVRFLNDHGDTVRHGR